MNSKKDLHITWLNFITKFTGKELDLTQKIGNTDLHFFEVENFLETGIKLNNSHGFLTLDFSHKSCKWNVQDFISVTQISVKSKKLEQGGSLRSVSWSREDYPCRIYGTENKGRIRFYKSDEITDFDELLDSYITVFQSVIFAIIKLKILFAAKAIEINTIYINNP